MGRGPYTRWIERHARQFSRAVAAAFSTPRWTAVTVAVAAVTYIVLILSTYPTYTFQLLGADLFYIDEALVALTDNFMASTGYPGLISVILYAVLAGIAVSTAMIQLLTVGIAVEGLGGLSSFVPTFLVSGCASCGVGVLSFLGVAGGVTVFPFGGTLVRGAGIAILLVFLARVGDPRTCDIA